MRHYSAHAAPALLPFVQFPRNSIEKRVRTCVGRAVHSFRAHLPRAGSRVQGVHDGGKNTRTMPGGRRFAAWCDAASMSISWNEFVDGSQTDFVSSACRPVDTVATGNVRTRKYSFCTVMPDYLIVERYSGAVFFVAACRLRWYLVSYFVALTVTPLAA